MLPGSEHVTTLFWLYGNFKYVVMPFVLLTAPVVFQRFMNSVLAKYARERVYVYLDDIIIMTTTIESNIESLIRVIGALLKENLRAKREKCEYLKEELDFLGFRVSKSRLLPRKQSIDGVAAWKLPNTQKEL
jgi:Reverse transcriptase (RNA-dependent DNA polymerase)